MFVSFNRNQQRSPLLRLPLELREMIYRYVLDTAIIRNLPGDRFWPRLRFQIPSLLLVARQVHVEASAFLDQYIAVRVRASLGHRRLLDYAIFDFIYSRESSFRAVQELEIPQRLLDGNVNIAFPYYTSFTQRHLPALETIVWTPGQNLSQREREETVRNTFGRSGLRIVDREAGVASDGAGDDDEWTDDEEESDEEDTKGKDDSGDYEDSSLDEDSP